MSYFCFSFVAMKFVFFAVVVFFLSLFLPSCTKDSTYIPYVPVNIQINLQNPDYVNIRSIGGWVYITGGSKGLIVYRADLNLFMVYDRHCPYNPTDSCSTVNAVGVTLSAVDPCCGSEFQLTDGSVLKGPATRALQHYQTSYDGNILSINN